MNKDLIARGYDAAALRYLAERDQLKSGKYVQKLLKLLRPASEILDLGCGAGVPVDDLFLKAGHNLTGIDISPEMIRLARKNLPAGNFVVGDLGDLSPGEFAADAIVSIYAMFHVPRSKHTEVLKNIRANLKKNGYLLITMGDKEFEGFTDFYGTRMWWSQWAPPINIELIRKAGFRIILDEIDTSGAEKHQVIMAQAI